MSKFLRSQCKFCGLSSLCFLVMLAVGLGGLKPASAMMQASEGNLAKAGDPPGAEVATSIA
jgi:hypothetical protein